ncbi:MAG: IPTL-CTERM sorting domain-containing protein [Phycisphaerales bacterium]|nr:IPTL-CTERM sorting domain-containing protein [Phycisphaerales bacterium]
MMSKTVIAIALAAAGAMANPALAATHVVTQSGFTFSPSTLTIDQGDTVEWHWTAGSHTVTSGPASCVPDGLFDVPLNSANAVQSMVFNSAGAFPYFCQPHCGIGMTGTITVNAGPAVPTVSEWGMIGLALLTLTGGTLIIRKATAQRRALA